MANIIEEQLLALTQLALILNNLNTFNYHGAHNNSDIQFIIVLLHRMHVSNKLITEVHQACTDFMTTNLPQQLEHIGVLP